MTDRDVSLLRRSWSAIERELSPRVGELIETPEFGLAVGILTRVNAFARRRPASAIGGIWHLLNLPTGTDVARLRRDVGALDRELRRLAMQLEAHPGSADRSPEQSSDDVNPDAADNRTVRTRKPRR